MERRISDTNVLTGFVKDFVGVLDKLKLKYIIVSGFVAIMHGRSRGTEDIDLILEKISGETFEKLYAELVRTKFECIQGSNPKELFEDYLKENTSLRFVRKGEFVPEMELKLAKDTLDEKQLEERTKLPLTKLPFYFSSIETNVAFKEELLKSPKDLEDARHLRTIYFGKINEEKVKEIKGLIRKYRLRD